MGTIAIEVVPPSVERGMEAIVEEAEKVRGLLDQFDLHDQVNTVVLPNIIHEDGDRPVALDEKFDAVELTGALSQHLNVSYILTQVTVFTPVKELEARVRRLRDRGIERLVFVGEPRELAGRPMVGPFPNEAMDLFRDIVPYRGAILIPTRVEEEGRFLQKLESGANFALTQLLFSDYVAGFLKTMAKYEHRPEVILSFGYVPKAELERGLVQWLIHDPIGELAKPEQEYVVKLADMPFNEKKAALVDLYKRAVEGAAAAGFPVGVHFEAPYGLSEPAAETFRAMLDAWSPR